ncbi:hypothetical protein WH50_03430 [Pokkaliibacter plantistimulans]|uniref:Uncharacterized protein n=1 Tax=Pokkaliibacter plantistimulans TaxID=1635171 RepID=A0ABX5M2C2_9GAMM|nr:hypothetical protein WH50_03430 [Pokkaliibacter plantistimulans]
MATGNSEGQTAVVTGQMGGYRRCTAWHPSARPCSAYSGAAPQPPGVQEEYGGKVDMTDEWATMWLIE